MLFRPLQASALAILLLACGAPEDDHQDGSRWGDYDERQQQLRERAREELAGSTYQDVHGSYGCTIDCSGHNAGYEWAQENDIEDAFDCGGTSQSFIEGCETYVGDLDDSIQLSTDDYEDYGSDW